MNRDLFSGEQPLTRTNIVHGIGKYISLLIKEFMHEKKIEEKKLYKTIDTHIL